MSGRRLLDLQRTFVVPTALGQSRPRTVRLTNTGRALTALAILLFAGAVAAGLALSRESRRRADVSRAFAESSLAAAGEVTRLWSNGDDRRRVEYRFVVDGRPYSGRARVSSERRRQLSVGDAIAVRYVSSDPRQNDLGGARGSGIPAAVPIAVAAGLALAGGLVLLPVRRQRRLLEEGRAAPAVVTAHTVHSGSHGDKHRSIAYEFPLLSGAVRKGTSATSDKPPAIGSVVCVVYDPELPKRNAVYPLSLVAPDHTGMS